MSETIQAPFAASWPKGVIARYLTLANATVDLIRTKNSSPAYIDGGHCTGCGHTIEWMQEEYGRERAQSHAETCRALPNPTA
ncbi:hypothetical protein [Streptomyces sp. H27-H5]|uniref:hypothetical protein n=1 Tax=Streptomyces sp. H27-H5 TaxID=2996460 RepID=UPI00226FDCB9|nr:hypothetical protein [Streptomyces sp. H27-H5]MCY0960850.1 hypothetical protein [Streptomyces sp. H27-H5]